MFVLYTHFCLVGICPLPNSGCCLVQSLQRLMVSSILNSFSFATSIIGLVFSCSFVFYECLSLTNPCAHLFPLTMRTLKLTQVFAKSAGCFSSAQTRVTSAFSEGWFQVTCEVQQSLSCRQFTSLLQCFVMTDLPLSWLTKAALQPEKITPV